MSFFTLTRTAILSESDSISLHEYNDDLHILTITRATQKNALSEKSIIEFRKALSLSRKDSPRRKSRMLIIQSLGNTFCAGADLHEMIGYAEKPRKNDLAAAQRLGELFYEIAAYPSPVITYVQGAALGGGVGIVAASDFVIAEEDACFGTPEVQLGIVPALISPYLTRKLSTNRAAIMMLTGTRISAHDALASELVSEVVSRNAREGSVIPSLLTALCNAAPGALRTSKKLILARTPLPSPRVRKECAEILTTTRRGSEAQAGGSAYFSKSTPPWRRTPQ
jgi:methylglutaconyl-CoA hydratase